MRGTLKEGTFDIGVYDLERDALDRITYAGDNLRPTWTADGARITYESNAEGSYNYYSIDADGSGVPERLLSTGQGFSESNSVWSPDGKHFLYSALNDETGWDLWILSPSEEADPRPLLETTADETWV